MVNANMTDGQRHAQEEAELKVSSKSDQVYFNPLVRLNVYKSALYGSFSTELQSDDLMLVCVFFFNLGIFYYPLHVNAHNGIRQQALPM